MIIAPILLRRDGAAADDEKNKNTYRIYIYIQNKIKKNLFFFPGSLSSSCVGNTRGSSTQGGK